MVSAWAFSLDSLPEPPPALPLPLNFIGQAAITIIIHCPGRPCSARSGGLLLALDSTEFWVSNTQSHLALSIPRDKFWPMLGALRPGLDYAAARRPRLTRRQLWGVIVRTVGHIAAALICSAVSRQSDHAWSFAVRVGL